MMETAIRGRRDFQENHENVFRRRAANEPHYGRDAANTSTAAAVDDAAAWFFQPLYGFQASQKRKLFNLRTHCVHVSFHSLRTSL